MYKHCADQVIRREYLKSLPHFSMWGLLRLFRVLKLFPSVGTNVVKHYTTVGVHRSFPQGVVSLVILRD